MMKKTSVVVMVTILIVTLSGLIYIGNSINNKNNSVKKAKVDGTAQGDTGSISQTSSSDITFGEYSCSISKNENLNAKYIKSGQTIRIYSLNPVPDVDSYDILPNGSMAVYLAKDGHLWIINNDGSIKKLTPEKYGNISKAEIQKQYTGYIWAANPKFTTDGSVVFSSSLPDTGGSSKKAIWRIELSSGAMKMMYTPQADSYRLLGSRADGKYMILDGVNIAVIDENGVFENIDVQDKYILSLSPDGRKLLYLKLDGYGKESSGSIYVMDCYGRNPYKLPGIVGCTPTIAGAWNEESSMYAMLMKEQSGGIGSVAVVSFDCNDLADIRNVKIESSIKLPENSKLRWVDENTVSADVGDDIISIDIHEQ